MRHKVLYRIHINKNYNTKFWAVKVSCPTIHFYMQCAPKDMRKQKLFLPIASSRDFAHIFIAIEKKFGHQVEIICIRGTFVRIYTLRTHIKNFLLSFHLLEMSDDISTCRGFFVKEKRNLIKNRRLMKCTYPNSFRLFHLRLCFFSVHLLSLKILTSILVKILSFL